MIAALWVIALAQGGAPVVTATVDRTRLGVGDALVLTIRARTRSPQPLKFTLPALPGFAIIATHEVSDVSLAGGVGAAMRTTVRQLTLRAERAGTLVIGPVRVQQGTKVFATRAISVTADSATGPVAALSPAARGLLETARSRGARTFFDTAWDPAGFQPGTRAEIRSLLRSVSVT